MGTLLASRLKTRRKELKMSQKELAEGICKQGQISRLENGEYTPGSELLHDLAKKLNVSMDYFFDEKISSESTELIEFKKISKTFITHRQYESLKYLYELEKETSHRLSLSDKIYMEWIGALVDFYFYGKKEEAITKLESVLQSTNETDLNSLQILNTLFNFYYDTENLVRFELIKEGLVNKIQQLKLITLEELELSIKFNYNLSRYLLLQKDTEQAIKNITKTIKFCQEYKTTYLLADLFLLLGSISKDFSDKTMVKEYFETARFLYKYLDENQEMALTLEHYIGSLSTVVG